MIKRFISEVNRAGASLRSWFGEREKRREARKEIFVCYVCRKEFTDDSLAYDEGQVGGLGAF
jgi:hypothetical protein